MRATSVLKELDEMYLRRQFATFNELRDKYVKNGTLTLIYGEMKEKT